MEKVRVYELAKELNTSSKRLMEKLNDINIHVKNHMSLLDEKDQEALYKHIGIKTKGEKEENNQVSKSTIVKEKAVPIFARENRANILDSDNIGRKIKYVYGIIENSRKRYGEFKKCEFHIHTPASYDYKLLDSISPEDFAKMKDREILDLSVKEGLLNEYAKEQILVEIDQYSGEGYNNVLIKQEKPFDSLKEYITYKLIAHKLYTNNVEVAIISDHNTIAGYKKLKFALEEYFKERKGALSKSIVLFLGVEFSCSEKNHVVGIFCEEKISEIEQFLNEIIISKEDGTYLTSHNVLEEIERMGGIGYIAHINTSEFFGNSAYKKKLYSSNSFNILGFTNISLKQGIIADKIKPFLNGVNKDFCCIVEGDSHSIDTIGLKNTWIKFSKVNFAALKRAFEDYNICINVKKPHKTNKYIKGLVVVPENYGFLRANPFKKYENTNMHDKNDFVVEFSQDLNCIIGGRGTGKSTLLNILETIFTLECDNNEVLKFISKHEQIFAVFHYNGNDYILRFIPQVKEIYDKDEEVSFLERAFTSPYYPKKGIYHLTNNWIQLYKVINGSDDKQKIIEPCEDYDILPRIYRRGYSINKLVNKINSGTIGDFIRNTVMYGINYQETRDYIELIYATPRNQINSFLRENLKNIISAYNNQKQIVLDKIEGFNKRHCNQMQIVYSPKQKDVEYYLKDILYEIRKDGKSNVANTFLKWDEVEYFLRQVINSMGYLNFLYCIFNRKIYDIEKVLKIYDVVDRTRITSKDIDEGYEDISKENLGKVYQAIFNKITKDKDGLIRSIERWLDVIDDFSIQFNINYKESVRQERAIFKDLEQLSLGQKVVAILTFVFNFGSHTKDNTPLIIDQPEDNLDNQYIFKNLVDSLRNIKNKRQVIVVTHSSTIVTNADAEQVIVMNSDNCNGWVDTSGYPSDKTIVSHIINHMEGGVDSFKNKLNKYKLFVDELNR